MGYGKPDSWHWQLVLFLSLVDRRSIKPLLKQQHLAIATTTTHWTQRTNYYGRMMISLMPADCIDAILAHLPLRDCLSLGSTSVSLLQDIQTELRRRRKRFFKSYCYSTRSLKPKLYPAEDHKNIRDPRILPTVAERIETLHKNLDPEHPSFPAVAELRKSLQDDTNKNEQRCNDFKSNVSSIVAMHRQNTVCFSLHARILRDAVRANPKSREGYLSLGQQCDRVMTVKIERYIGDVLCAYYMMGHVSAGLVEGGPTEEQWIDSLSEDIGCLDLVDSCAADNLTPQGVPSSAWYRAWIFLHSNLLRNAPFTTKQQARLGIHSTADQEANVPLQGAPVPFAGCKKAGLMRGLSRISNFESIRITYKDFGRLGPTFRGRDLIQTQTIYPLSPIGTVVAFETLSPLEYSRKENETLEFLRQWRDEGDHVIRWMLQMHEESYKTRPMTVSPPLVTIRCST